MENEVLVRTARPSERNALEALQLRASLNNPGDREALLANPDAIALSSEQIARGRVFVVEVARSTKGFAAILRRDDGNLELDALFVEPTEWRRGFGSRLLDRCAQEARTGGAKAIHVVGNPHAEGFYMARGFEILGKRMTRLGVGILMRKVL
ncbi:MAG TPA: GNAT family N-acetyltransferase [Casimicrobiaceae bacterium]|nr:GNAT family N-acetyltransferase [Casimicrobiaceae bacterium]